MFEIIQKIKANGKQAFCDIINAFLVAGCTYIFFKLFEVSYNPKYITVLFWFILLLLIVLLPVLFFIKKNDKIKNLFGYAGSFFVSIAGAAFLLLINQNFSNYIIFPACIVMALFCLAPFICYCYKEHYGNIKE